MSWSTKRFVFIYLFIYFVLTYVRFQLVAFVREHVSHKV